jgi:hypothetical protein
MLRARRSDAEPLVFLKLIALADEGGISTVVAWLDARVYAWSWCLPRCAIPGVVRCNLDGVQSESAPNMKAGHRPRQSAERALHGPLCRMPKVGGSDPRLA